MIKPFQAYINDESAKAAVEELNETDFNKEKLIVEFSGVKRTSKESDKCRYCQKQGHWYVRDNLGKETVQRKDGQPISEEVEGIYFIDPQIKVT